MALIHGPLNWSVAATGGGPISPLLFAPFIEPLAQLIIVGEPKSKK